MKSPVLMAIASGALAAIAAGLGKIALSHDTFVTQLITSNCNWAIEAYVGLDVTPYKCEVVVPLLVRMAIFLIMLYCNALMLSLFLKALGVHGSLEVVVLNSSVNFVFTGLIGHLLFRESVSRYWVFGIALIAIGISLITLSGQTRAVVKTESDAERRD
jgi:uncharacterized membrane protein